jgi:hypothetical protein
VLSLAGGHARRALTREGVIPVLAFRVSRYWEGRVGNFDSQTREWRVVTSAFWVRP